MFSKLNRKRKPKRKSTLSTSTTVPFLKRKETSAYAFKFTSSDPQLQRMLMQLTLSEEKQRANRGRKDGASEQFFGVSRKRMQHSASIERTQPEDSRPRSEFLAELRLPPRSVALIKRERNDGRLAKLDHDHARTPSLRECWSILSLCDVRPRLICDTRTRRGWHRTIQLSQRLTSAELVALQSCLGSDPRREALNLMRVLSQRKDGATNFARARWNLLFERKLKL